MAFHSGAGRRAKQIEPGLYGLKLIDGAQGAQRISLIRGWLEPGARHSAHTHDVEEAVVFLGGRGIVELGEERIDVSRGDAVHIPPGVVHSTLNTGSEDLSFIAAFADALITSDTAMRAGHVPEARTSSIRHRIAWLLRRTAARIGRRRGA